MQVVVMRALYSNTATPGRPNDACCFPTARSQTFTPRANAITTVNVNLPVKEDATPPADDLSTIADFDTIALAVLAPGVPVPLYYTGDSTQPADFIWNTATPSTTVPGFSSDTGGFFVALGAEWTAGGGGGSGGAVGLPRGDVRVRDGNAQLPLNCLANAQCAGQLLLQSGAATTARDTASTAAGRAFAARIATYGTASFSISKRTHKTIAVGLNSAGRRLLRSHRSVKVWANVRLKHGAIRTMAARITLKRYGARAGRLAALVAKAFGIPAERDHAESLSLDVERNRERGQDGPSVPRIGLKQEGAAAVRRLSELRAGPHDLGT
jgi:hypothetical protein